MGGYMDVFVSLSGCIFDARSQTPLYYIYHPLTIRPQPHGRAFKIINKERFVRDIIPKYYVSKKFETFARQLNGWGFKRLHQTGPGKS